MPCVLTTENVVEYALVVAALSRLSNKLGVDELYPLLTDVDHLPTLQPIFEHYQIEVLSLGQLAPSKIATARSRELIDFIGGCDETIEISSAASELLFAQAVLRSLMEARILLVTDSPVTTITGVVAVDNAQSAPILAVRRNCSLVLPAVFYAHVTGKRLVLFENNLEAESLLVAGDGASVLVVDEHTAFTKSFLDRLIHASQRTADAVKFGVLTAFSQREFSGLVLRLLALRDFHRKGRHDAYPPAPGQFLMSREMPPHEYYIIEDHGGAQHMKHGPQEAICGSFVPELRPNGSFNCEFGCPFPVRVRSSELKVHNLFLLGCDTMTFGDGLVPPEFTLGLNALNGWAVSVIAPFKHRTGAAMASLTDALIRSAFTLGEIVWQLNSVGRFGTEPDPCCLLLGDPELTPVQGITRSSASIDFVKTATGVQVHCTKVVGHVLKCCIRGNLVSPEQPLTVIPLQDTLDSSDYQFTFNRHNSTSEIQLLLFSTGPEFAEELLFRIEPAGRTPERAIQRVQTVIAQLSQLVALGISPEVAANLCNQVRAQLGLLVSYPRDLERLDSASLIAEPDQAIDAMVRKVRHAVIMSLLGAMASRNLWLLNQRFTPLVRKRRRSENQECCRLCGSALVVWDHEDPLTFMARREVWDCMRCGIVSDQPFPRQIDVAFDADSGVPLGPSFKQELVVRNLTDRRLTVALLVQFNCWEMQGIAGDPMIHDLLLEPKEIRQLSVEFFLDLTRPDDVVTMQAFSLSGELSLSNFLRKIAIGRRQVLAEHPEYQAVLEGSQSESWVWDGEGFNRVSADPK